MWSGTRYHLVISGMGCNERGIWDLAGFGVGFKKRQSSGMGCNERGIWDLVGFGVGFKK